MRPAPTRSSPTRRPRTAAAGRCEARAMNDRSHQNGLSLVELLVGLALGLFVVAVAATLLAAQTPEQRRLAAEQRLMQDLRTATDVVTRDLRRAGHWGAAASGV